MEILKIYLEEQLLVKVLRNKAFNIAEKSKCSVYQRGVVSAVDQFFDKRSLIVMLYVHGHRP